MAPTGASSVQQGEGLPSITPFPQTRLAQLYQLVYTPYGRARRILLRRSQGSKLECEVVARATGGCRRIDQPGYATPQSTVRQGAIPGVSAETKPAVEAIKAKLDRVKSAVMQRTGRGRRSPTLMATSRPMISGWPAKRLQLPTRAAHGELYVACAVRSLVQERTGGNKTSLQAFSRHRWGKR
jgi:hypothetical protein